jgi:hypothetical protein
VNRVKNAKNIVLNMNILKVDIKMKTIKLRDTRGNETTATIMEDKKEINRNRVKKWREDNPDKYKEHLEYVKQWKHDNKKHVKEYRHNYYQEHKEESKEYFSRPEVKERINRRQRERRMEKKLGYANK